MSHNVQRTGAAASSNVSFSMIALTSLFFMWGFITSMNDVLIPHLKGVFSLNYTQAMLIQFCFFGAYFLVSVPAGRLVNRVGYQKGISIGLFTAALGCVMFVPSATQQAYWMFLTALFVLASGVTILQVAANPLVTLLGSPETSSKRLTFTQAFNSLGATLGPIVGGFLLFTLVGAAHGETADASAVILPYVILAATLFFLSVLFIKLPLPTVAEEHTETVSAADASSLLSHRHLLLGALGIFVYVGAEVSIGSFLVNFLGEPQIAGMSEAQAANYVAYYWGGALIGRFLGVAVMQVMAPARLLLSNALISVGLLAVVLFGQGQLAMWALLLVGLCNSIMFPTIFSLALRGLGSLTGRASGLLCLAIVGGAIVPLLQGILADNIGLQASFVLPLLCYLYIGYYGGFGAAPKTQPESGTASAAETA